MRLALGFGESDEDAFPSIHVGCLFESFACVFAAPGVLEDPCEIHQHVGVRPQQFRRRDESQCFSRELFRTFEVAAARQDLCTHRRTIGLLLSQLGSLLAQARLLGLEGDAVSQLEAKLRCLSDETDAIMPRPPKDRWQGLLSQLYVLTYELRPRALRSYGELSSEAADYLEWAAAELSDLAGRISREASDGSDLGGAG